MRIYALLIAAFVAVFGLSRSAEAAVTIQIDLSAQRMHVTSSKGDYTFAISSARAGFVTPRGSYRPQRLEKMHYSRKYHMSPMPHSIFFRGGYAIHGTGSVGQLGRPASHGCIRLAPGNAALLYAMVKAEGARISISGSPPRSTMYAKVKPHHTATRLAGQHQRHQNPLAYAPVPRSAPGPIPFKVWLGNPLGSSR